MRKIRQLLGILTFSCCICLAQAATDTSESVDQAWKKAVLAGDVDAVMAVYANDAIGWFPGEAACKGKEAIRQSYTRFFGDNAVTAADITNNQTQSCGDRAVSWGEYSMTIKPKKGGDTTTFTGRFTEILKKEGGNWVYFVDHASANPKPNPGKP